MSVVNTHTHVCSITVAQGHTHTHTHMSDDGSMAWVDNDERDRAARGHLDPCLPGHEHEWVEYARPAIMGRYFPKYQCLHCRGTTDAEPVFPPHEVTDLLSWPAHRIAFPDQVVIVFLCAHCNQIFQGERWEGTRCHARPRRHDPAPSARPAPASAPANPPFVPRAR